MFQEELHQDHVVVERIQYHEVPFIPPNAGGEETIVHEEEVEEEMEDEEDRARLTQHIVEYQDTDSQEPAISGQTRAKLIERLASRVEYPEPLPEEKPAKKKKARQRKSESTDVSGTPPKKAKKRRKTASLSVDAGETATPMRMEPLKIPVLPSSMLASANMSSVSPKRQKEPLQSPEVSTGSVSLASPPVTQKSPPGTKTPKQKSQKTKKLSPIQKRHPTMLSLLSKGPPPLKPKNPK